MGCGCNKKNNVPPPSQAKQVDELSGKMIVDDSNRELLVVSAIYDPHQDIIGYVTRDSAGQYSRIFSKNIIKVLE
jgi:hypothetical protein